MSGISANDSCATISPPSELLPWNLPLVNRVRCLPPFSFTPCATVVNPPSTLSAWSITSPQFWATKYTLPPVESAVKFHCAGNRVSAAAMPPTGNQRRPRRAGARAAGSVAALAQATHAASSTATTASPSKTLREPYCGNHQKPASSTPAMLPRVFSALARPTPRAASPP